MDFFTLSKQIENAFEVKQKEYTQLDITCKELSEKNVQLKKQVAIFEAAIQKLLQEKVALEISLRG